MIYILYIYIIYIIYIYVQCTYIYIYMYIYINQLCVSCKKCQYIFILSIYLSIYLAKMTV